MLDVELPPWKSLKLRRLDASRLDRLVITACTAGVSSISGLSFWSIHLFMDTSAGSATMIGIGFSHMV